MKKNEWEEKVTSSHTQTVEAIILSIGDENYEAVSLGLHVLLEALGNSDKRYLRTLLRRLMKYIIKWETQPECRNPRWIGVLYDSRLEIEDLLEYEPSLRMHVESYIIELFPKSKLEAEKEMRGKETGLKSLSYDEVMSKDYTWE